MSKEGLSRRSFLRNTAVGSSGAALAFLPMTHTAAAEAPPAPPWPVPVESYPLTEASAAASQAHLKLVTASGGLASVYKEKLQAYAPNLEIKVCRSKEEFHQEVVDAHIIFGGCSREDFLAARNLRWIQYSATGVEGILPQELVESPVVLTNMQRKFSPTISETAIGLLPTLTRRLHDCSQMTRERRWSIPDGLSDISGLTMGIVGRGGIGTDTAYRTHYGFHMRILGTDPKAPTKAHFCRRTPLARMAPQNGPAG